MKNKLKNIFCLIYGYIRILFHIHDLYTDTLRHKGLLKIPRYRNGIFRTSQYTIHYTDPTSLYYQYREIVTNEIYKWTEDTCGQFEIIDCGANIGVSALYFSKTYPHAHITAFEPNPIILPILRKNICKNKNIKLREEAVWISNGKISFKKDNADAGSVIEDGSETKVLCVRLRDIIDKNIDFLKIDIEGAEYQILIDIKDKLQFVKNMFIEFHADDLNGKKLIDILKILTDCGFEYYLKTESAPKSPFTFKKKGADEFYFQINIFASKK